MIPLKKCHTDERRITSRLPTLSSTDYLERESKRIRVTIDDPKTTSLFNILRAECVERVSRHCICVFGIWWVGVFLWVISIIVRDIVFRQMQTTSNSTSPSHSRSSWNMEMIVLGMVTFASLWMCVCACCVYHKTVNYLIGHSHPPLEVKL